MTEDVPIVMVKRPGPLEPAVAEFITRSGQPLVLVEAEREELHPEPEKNRCCNIAKQRTEAFRKALQEYPEARFFFSLDADVVPPFGSIEALHTKRSVPCAQGGWFPAQRGQWVGGRFVAPGRFEHFAEVREGMTETDLLSLGCTLLRREWVDGHEFDPGIDRFVHNGNGELCHVADSGAFSEFLRARGVRLFLDGDVVARHIGANEEVGSKEEVGKSLGATSMKLTNQQVEDALNALMRFNPKCSYKVKMRLTRNLRRLKQAWEEKEHDRQVLMCEAVKDKTRRQENGQLALSAEECAEVARMTRELMKSEVDVDLHPVPLFDSTEHGEVPDGIDVVTVPIENVIWTALIDVVFSETTGQQAAQPAA